MVDINLFDDEPEEENIGQGDPSFDSLDDTGGLDLGGDLSSDDTAEGGFGEEDLHGDFGESTSEESIDDALGFDDDLSETGSLGAEGLMEEDIPDLEDEDMTADDEDYDFGGGGRKKTSPLLILILVAVGLIALYLTYGNTLKTLLMPEKKTVARTSRTQIPQRQQRVAGQTGTTKPGSTAADTSKTAAPITQMAASANSPLITAATKILNDLSGQGQFAMTIVEPDRFITEYVSSTKGASGTFGQRLQNLVGAASYVASPEDMHSVNGKTVYFGVISGKLDPSKMSGPSTSSPFATEAAFITAINTLIQQQNLSKIGQNKRATQGNGTQQEITYEVIAGGEKTKAIAFLQSLNTLSKGCKPVKISLSPMDLNDFNAVKVKMVLDIKVIISPAQSTPAKPAM